MIFNVDKKELKKGIGFVKPIIPSSPVIELDKYLLVEIVPGFMLLKASDGTRLVHHKVPISGEITPVSFCIDYKKFEKCITKSGDDLLLEVDSDSKVVRAYLEQGKKSFLEVAYGAALKMSAQTLKVLESFDSIAMDTCVDSLTAALVFLSNFLPNDKDSNHSYIHISKGIGYCFNGFSARGFSVSRAFSQLEDFGIKSNSVEAVIKSLKNINSDTVDIKMSKVRVQFETGNSILVIPRSRVVPNVVSKDYLKPSDQSVVVRAGDFDTLVKTVSSSSTAQVGGLFAATLAVHDQNLHMRLVDDRAQAVASIPIHGDYEFEDKPVECRMLTGLLKTTKADSDVTLIVEKDNNRFYRIMTKVETQHPVVNFGIIAYARVIDR